MKSYSMIETRDIFAVYNGRAGLVGSKRLPTSSQSFYPWINRFNPPRRSEQNKVLISEQNLTQFAEDILDYRRIPFNKALFQDILDNNTP